MITTESVTIGLVLSSYGNRGVLMINGGCLLPSAGDTTPTQ